MRLSKRIWYFGTLISRPEKIFLSSFWYRISNALHREVFPWTEAARKLVNLVSFEVNLIDKFDVHTSIYTLIKFVWNMLLHAMQLTKTSIYGLLCMYWLIFPNKYSYIHTIQSSCFQCSIVKLTTDYHVRQVRTPENNLVKSETAITLRCKRNNEFTWAYCKDGVWIYGDKNTCKSMDIYFDKRVHEYQITFLRFVFEFVFENW